MGVLPELTLPYSPYQNQAGSVLLADYAATGLPPAYIPKPENPKEEKDLR